MPTLPLDGNLLLAFCFLNCARGCCYRSQTLHASMRSIHPVPPCSVLPGAVMSYPCWGGAGGCRANGAGPSLRVYGSSQLCRRAVPVRVCSLPLGPKSRFEKSTVHQAYQRQASSLRSASLMSFALVFTCHTSNTLCNDDRPDQSDSLWMRLSLH